MYYSAILLSSVTALAAAVPTKVVEARAGGPAITPLPPTCTAVNVLPSPTANMVPLPGLADFVAWKPNFPESESDEQTRQLAEDCVLQCHSIGISPPCVAAYFRHDATHGASGNTCIGYNRLLQASDFAMITDVVFENVTATNILCADTSS